MHQFPKYPFAALVGLEQLKSALLLNAIAPAIGGVLIRGEKGSAKSTAARALRDVLPFINCVRGCPFHCHPRDVWPECPHCAAAAGCVSGEVELPVPFVDLPLGATEDRVLGTLDFERAVRESRRAFQPGLLAEAHRGILYIDEVNLLADHLVDILLDAAAMGVNTVEREGVAVTHPARFVLIGTMNPEEGDLRPQLLDRFGLMVTVASPREPDARTLVVRRRLEYEHDPVAFQAAWQNDQQLLRDQILTGQMLVRDVTLEDGLASFISRLCCELEVDGLRADLVMNKTARALAALAGRLRVTLEDIRAAAELVLPHRRRRKPFERPGLDKKRLDELFDQQAKPTPAPRAEPSTDAAQTPQPTRSDNPAAEAPNHIAQPTSAPPVRRIEVLQASPSAAPAPGRRNGTADQKSGHYVRAVPGGKLGDVAIDATVRAAARRGTANDGKLDIQPADWHRKERAGTTGTLILLVVDASGSMAARRRMEAVKGAVLGLLQDAYQQRDQVGLVVFRGVAAEVLLPPTRSLDVAERALWELPTGGRTPLAHALALAQEMLAQSRRTHPELPVLLVLLSDGKGNVPLPDEPGDPWQQALDWATRLAGDGTPALVLDSEAGFVRLGRARRLAEALAAECLILEELSAPALLLKIRQLV